MKPERMRKCLVRFFVGCLVAYAGPAHAIQKPKDTVRLKTELLSPAATYQEQDEVEFTFVNRSRDNAWVMVKVLDERGQRVSFRKFSLAPGASIRNVFFDEASPASDARLLRFEIDSFVTCKQNPTLREAKEAVLVAHGVRRSATQLREVLVSSSERPCMALYTPPDGKPSS